MLIKPSSTNSTTLCYNVEVSAAWKVVFTSVRWLWSNVQQRAVLSTCWKKSSSRYLTVQRIRKSPSKRFVRFSFQRGRLLDLVVLVKVSNPPCPWCLGTVAYCSSPTHNALIYCPVSSMNSRGIEAERTHCSNNSHSSHVILNSRRHSFWHQQKRHQRYKLVNTWVRSIWRTLFPDVLHGVLAMASLHSHLWTVLS